jgi:hypothetical protein
MGAGDPVCDTQYMPTIEMQKGHISVLLWMGTKRSQIFMYS